MARAGFPRVVIIAVYFGRLPAYFQLWLDSCRRNHAFDWLVVTDAETAAYDWPANVRARPMTLMQFRARMSATLGLEIHLRSPYKACDFRPIFWTLLEGEERACDFWGHCDLDVIFGNLARYVTIEMLARYDRIFTLGHLTLYRNADFSNRMGLRPHRALDWREILSDPEHRGFDEHIGVGLIWRDHRARMFKDESIVADIDPAIARFERVAPYRNDREQLFFHDRGRVLRVFWRNGRRDEEEFAYIHFQKRRSMTALPPPGTESYVIAPGGFFACDASDLSPDLARRLNPWRPDLRDSFHRWRSAFRSFRRRKGFVRDLRRAAP